MKNTIKCIWQVFLIILGLPILLYWILFVKIDEDY